jgi:hypothetical protein
MNYVIDFLVGAGKKYRGINSACWPTTARTSAKRFAGATR